MAAVATDSFVGGFCFFFISLVACCRQVSGSLSISVVRDERLPPAKLPTSVEDVVLFVRAHTRTVVHVQLPLSQQI